MPSSGRKYLWAHHMVGNVSSLKHELRCASCCPKLTNRHTRTPKISGVAISCLLLMRVSTALRSTWAETIGRRTALPRGTPLQRLTARLSRCSCTYIFSSVPRSALNLPLMYYYPYCHILIFSSLDMTSLPCDNAAQAVTYAKLVSSYKSHPNQAFYQNKLLLTMFDGAYCTFGQGNVNAGWAYFRSQLAALSTPVYIMPSLFVDVETQTWYDGHFDWDNSWPSAGRDLDGSQDLADKAKLAQRGKGYMPGVSPAFFTYYAPSSYNKNWIYRSDDWLLATRLEQMIKQRASHDMAELISWNGESI